MNKFWFGLSHCNGTCFGNPIKGDIPFTRDVENLIHSLGISKAQHKGFCQILHMPQLNTFFDQDKSLSVCPCLCNLHSGPRHRNRPIGLQAMEEPFFNWIVIQWTIDISWPHRCERNATLIQQRLSLELSLQKSHKLRNPDPGCSTLCRLFGSMGSLSK